MLSSPPGRFLPKEGGGVYSSRWCYGSPAHKYSLGCTNWIVEVRLLWLFPPPLDSRGEEIASRRLHGRLQVPKQDMRDCTVGEPGWWESRERNPRVLL